MEQNTTEKVGLDNKKKIIIIISAIFVALLITYIGFSIYFMNHFHFRTTIIGVKVSGSSVEIAKEKVQTAMEEYELTVVERDGSTDAISGKSIDLEVVWENQVDELMKKQNGFAWIVKLFVPDEFQPAVETTYNQEKLMAEIDGLSCMAEEKQIAPQNAGVSEYSSKNGYTLLPAVEGSQINKEALRQAVNEYIDKVKSELNLKDELCYVQPGISDDNEMLLNAIAQLNKSLNTVITYQIGDSIEVLDASIFQPWLYVDEGLNVCVREEELGSYVKGLASKYNTCYDAKKLMTSYGQEVTITNSRYGWKVDNATEKTAIVAELMAGEPVTRDLNYSMTASSHEGHDYGNSYVEINLTAQHLFLYVDGQLVLESDFVSGDLSEGNGSPTGAFGLTYKDKDAVLRGRDYTTPVTYWMPFAGNVGMHDATWRDEFGGSIYKRDGSHGCINLPKSKAKIIFEHVKKGFPVLCYELEGTQSEKGIAQDQAYVVMDAIKAIGEVSLASEAVIINARTQYDTLSEMAKTYVENYQVLVDAENTLNALKAAQVPVI